MTCCGRPIATGASLAPLGKRLVRNRAGIAHRASELDLQGTHARPNGWRTEPAWTEADVAILRRDYGRVPTPELAARLGRKKGGVYNRAHMLGLVHGFMRPFSADEDRAIRLAHCHGVSITDLSRALGRDDAVVSKYAIRIGVLFSVRTARAPRGSLAKRPPVTLASILALADDAAIAAE